MIRQRATQGRLSNSLGVDEDERERRRRESADATVDGVVSMYYRSRDPSPARRSIDNEFGGRT